MQHKFPILLATLLLFSLLIAPVGTASALAPNLIQDPSLEAAISSTVIWKQASTNSDTPLCLLSIPECNFGAGTTAPRTGSVWALFGGIDWGDEESISPEVGDLYQNVTFPTCGASLQFYFWIGAAPAGSDANDVFNVKIDGITVFSANATQKSSYSSYTLVNLDVSAYANGAVHKVEFHSVTTGQTVIFNLDDISLTQTCVSISGNAGVASATLNYTGGSATADGSGDYSFNVPYEWSGTVTPSKTGYAFSPVSRTYSNLTTNQTGQNYTAAVVYLISGNVGVGGVTLSYNDNGPQTATSDSNGDYSFTVSNNWSGTVTPSHSCFTFNPTSRNYSNVTANQTSQNYSLTSIGGAGCATINALIAGNNMGSYGLLPGQGLRDGYPGVDNGPAKIVSTNSVNILSALRVIWKEPGPRYSYSEMMGLPVEQLSDEYWFPWYNNAAINSMDQGFRIANVDTASGNTVEVRVGNTLLETITLPAGGSVRVGYTVDNGPIRIVCTTCSNTGNDKIIAALRVIWKEPGFRSSYSEMMGLPKEQLSSEYWFPWYNNATVNSMDQGFRIANVDLASGNTVEVWIGNTKWDTINLEPGGSTRVGYPVDNSPARIVCTTCTNTGNDKIVAALRVIWKEPGFRSSYSEMMGLPKEGLSNEYWFPWYNNAVPNSMDQGFRIANVDTASSNTVEIWVGSTKLDTISMGPGGSTRVGYAVDNGPTRIVCTTCTNTGNDKIIAALRVIWKEPGFRSSYSEMMGLPSQQLSTEYWFPWYNNAVPNSMDQGFRIAVP